MATCLPQSVDNIAEEEVAWHSNDCLNHAVTVTAASIAYEAGTLPEWHLLGGGCPEQLLFSTGDVASCAGVAILCSWRGGLAGAVPLHIVPILLRHRCHQARHAWRTREGLHHTGGTVISVVSSLPANFHSWEAGKPSLAFWRHCMSDNTHKSLMLLLDHPILGDHALLLHERI